MPWNQHETGDEPISPQAWKPNRTPSGSHPTYKYKTHRYSWRIFPPMSYNSTIRNFFTYRVMRVSINWSDK